MTAEKKGKKGKNEKRWEKGEKGEKGWKKGKKGKKGAKKGIREKKEKKKKKKKKTEKKGEKKKKNKKKKKKKQGEEGEKGKQEKKKKRSNCPSRACILSHCGSQVRSVTGGLHLVVKRGQSALCCTSHEDCSHLLSPYPKGCNTGLDIIFTLTCFLLAILRARIPRPSCLSPPARHVSQDIQKKTPNVDFMDRSGAAISALSVRTP